MGEIGATGSGAGDVDMSFALSPALDDLAAGRANQAADAAVLAGEVEICRANADPGGGGQTIGQQSLAEAASLIGVFDGDADLRMIILGLEELKRLSMSDVAISPSDDMSLQMARISCVV
jgi:hypothetical protein